MILQPLCYTENCTELPIMVKVANNGLVGATSGGDECCWLHRHAIMSCNVKQVVCAIHTAPYLGVGVKQAVSLVGEDLCEACKQSNKTIGSDDVT